MNTWTAILFSIVFGAYALVMPSFFIWFAWSMFREGSWGLGIIFSLAALAAAPVTFSLGVKGALLPWK